MSSQVALSAFGDEIADELSEQLGTLVQLKIGYLELRGVWGKNVLALSDDEVHMIREQCRTSGIKVSAIGSPIGKSPLAQPPEQELENLERAFEIASALGVHLVRVFSFYPPEGAAPAAHDQYVAESIERLSELAALAERRGFTLLLENEKGIVGDTIARCRTLLAGVDSAALRFAWDPANFVQVGEDAPTEDGWPALGAHVAHVHVKDALANGEVRPAGQGDGQVGMLLDRLRTSSYSGFLALEPHLAIAGHSSGFSGVEGMAHATAVLRQLMQQHQIQEVAAV